MRRENNLFPLNCTWRLIHTSHFLLLGGIWFENPTYLQPFTSQGLATLDSNESHRFINISHEIWQKKQDSKRNAEMECLKKDATRTAKTAVSRVGPRLASFSTGGADFTNYIWCNIQSGQTCIAFLYLRRPEKETRFLSQGRFHIFTSVEDLGFEWQGCVHLLDEGKHGKGCNHYRVLIGDIVLCSVVNGHGLARKAKETEKRLLTKTWSVVRYHIDVNLFMYQRLGAQRGT